MTNNGFGCPGSGIRLLALLAFSGLAAQAHAVYDPVFKTGFETVPTFYVSASNGNNGNPGTLAQPWKTISHAVQDSNGAPSGSVVYVAAGIYNEHVVVARDNLTLIAYKATPGDQPPVLVSLPIDPSTLADGYEFNPADMPLLDGGDRTSGVAFMMRNRKGITLRNFSIRGYAAGIRAGHQSNPVFVEGALIDNVNMSNLGDLSAGYSGHGMAFGQVASRIYSHGNRVQNSLVVNAAAEGISFFGNGNEVDNVRVYGAESSNATDYYVMVWGSDNRISNSYIWHKLGTPHWSHGFSVKDNGDQLDGGSRILAERNVFVNNVAVNMGEGFTVRHRGARYNVFINNTAYGPWGQTGGCGSAVGTDGGAIQIRDGASFNQFINTVAHDTCIPLRISETTEDDTLNDLPREARGNVIDGLISEHSTYAIYLVDSGSQDIEVGTNIVRNSQFLEVKWPFVIDLPPGQLLVENSQFVGDGTDPIFGWGNYLSSLQANQFVGCTFTGFPLPNWW